MTLRRRACQSKRTPAKRVQTARSSTGEARTEQETEAAESIDGERSAETDGKTTVLKSRKRRYNDKTSTGLNYSNLEDKVQATTTGLKEDEKAPVHLETAQKKAKEIDETTSNLLWRHRYGIFQHMEPQDEIG